MISSITCIVINCKSKHLFTFQSNSFSSLLSQWQQWSKMLGFEGGVRAGNARPSIKASPLAGLSPPETAQTQEIRDIENLSQVWMNLWNVSNRSSLHSAHLSLYDLVQGWSTAPMEQPKRFPHHPASALQWCRMQLPGPSLSAIKSCNNEMINLSKYPFWYLSVL